MSQMDLKIGQTLYPDDEPRDTQSVWEADAFHILMERVDFTYWRDHVPEGFDLAAAKANIEQYNMVVWRPFVLPPLVNLNRKSEAIAIRYAGMGSLEAVSRFYSEAYVQSLDHGQTLMTAQVAISMCMTCIEQRFQGFYPDDACDEVLDRDPVPVEDDGLLTTAATWYVMGMAAISRGEYKEIVPRCMRRHGKPVDDMYQLYAGNESTSWSEIVSQTARDMGPVNHTFAEMVLSVVSGRAD